MKAHSYEETRAAPDESSRSLPQSARTLGRRPYAVSVLALLLAAGGCAEDGKTGAEEPDGKDDAMQTEGSARASDGRPAATDSRGDAAAGTNAAAASATPRTADAATPASKADVSSPVEAGASAPAVKSDEAVAKSLVGSYAAMLKYRDVVSVGIAGMGSLVTTALGTAEIREDAKDGARMDLSLCSARTAAEEGGQKHVLDLVLTVPAQVLALTRFESPAIRATREGGQLMWQMTELYGVAGWKSAAPSDKLPTSADDPRVFDQDKDGFPGVSAAFTGHADGSVYLAMAYRFLLSGTQASNGDLVGAMTSQSRESLLGSTELLLTGMMIERSADPSTADNKARFVRQSSKLSCEQVLAQQSTLFP